MSRTLHAVVLPPGPLLARRLEAALDGSGPAICPLSPALPEPALRAVLDALAPAAVETPDGTAARESGRPTDAAVLIATSGSTGRPKIVELSAEALRFSANATLHRVGAAPGDRWLCCLPTDHIAGIQVLTRSVVAGTTPIIQERFSPAEALASGAQHISVVPTQLRRMLDHDLSVFSSILLGGAAAPPDLLASARAAGARVLTTYGMSETCGGCVYDGVPLDGVSAAVGDDGRIRLAGPVLFGGYRLRPDLTAGVLDGDWFVTSDLGVIEKGTLRIRGRADDVINTGGEKVVAGEVEHLLRSHPAVQDVVVVGRPDQEWGELVTAVVVGSVTLGELRDHVRATLPAHAAPRALELVPEIPLLPSGKPDRVRLRRPL
ncbi:AMP-binding protein [Actinomadura sp. DC4]|uniref:AMP-binding protein n=1 Tax=Actinomadura sp. DC4 TaxID=3055069 RepID=UPI0025B1B1E1|nr:AMP-binding protein [Actinomadura sp. DC4]MDN3359443.1 AMP-binding protein [Actinomadura sp. DC4]